MVSSLCVAAPASHSAAEPMPRHVVLLLVLALLAPVTVMAETPISRDRETVLHLAEHADRLVHRDRLRAVLRAEAIDADAVRLQAELNRRMTAAVAQAKAVAGIAVATGGYSVFQERPNDKPPQWRGLATLSLVGHDGVALLALVGSLQQDGLLLSSLAYELTPEAARSIEDELADEAIARLQARARRVAGSLGLAVQRLRNVTVGNANGAQPIPRPMLMARQAGPAETPPVGEPGEASVSVSVDAEIVLVPLRSTSDHGTSR
jgi:predicted secreted protein